MTCSEVLVGICLTPADQTQTQSLFGFSEYLTALALLTIVYSLSDRLYHFRLATAPVSLFRWTFVAIIALGLVTLATELWFAEGWLAPAAGLSKAAIEGTVGLLVLALAGVGGPLDLVGLHFTGQVQREIVRAIYPRGLSLANAWH